MSSQKSRAYKSALQALLITAVFGFPFQDALAVEPAQGGNCAGAPVGTYAYIEDPKTSEGHQLVCDGTHWQSVLDYNAAAALITHDNKACGSGEVLAFDGTIWACSAARESGVLETDTNVTRPTSGTADYGTTE